MSRIDRKRIRKPPFYPRKSAQIRVNLRPISNTQYPATAAHRNRSDRVMTTPLLPPQKAHAPTSAATHLAQLRDRLCAYVAARPAAPDIDDLAPQLTPYVQRTLRLKRLIETLHARSLPVDLQALIDETLIAMEEEGFFDLSPAPAPPPPPSDPEDTPRLPSQKHPHERH
jgi:hypothetical protein